MTHYMPGARRGVVLREARQSLSQAARAVTPADAVIVLRTFYKDFVAMAHAARYGDSSGTLFLDRHTPAWDGGFDEALGRNYQSFWARLIDKCGEQGVDPAAYLAWRYSVWCRGVLQSPYDIERNFAFEQFRQRESGEELAQTELITMQNQLQQLQFKYESIYGYSAAAAASAAIIAGGRQHMTQLFIFCVALRCGLSDAAAQAHAAAVYEYVLGRDAFDKVWGDLIPGEFRDTPSMALLACLQGRDG
jgi:hypothetical protein